MRRNRSPQWTLTILFLLSWLGASVTPFSAQSPSADQVWDQLQSLGTAARNDGFKQLYYMVGWLSQGESAYNLAPFLSAGSSYLIVGVCDNDCSDVDLALRDGNAVEVASDTAADDTPLIRFTPSTTGTYVITPRMPDCRVEPCGYGIGVFVK
ncbi:MAG TPA: hypothetical protein VEY33_12865 [Gemmatimonadota bacterium]|nr:hypothetical protein [Gemmatimonadota bacterium]